MDWKQVVRKLKQDVMALALSSRDSRVPWAARVLAVCVVAYALSPIDLIPDFIPVLGMLDDLLLLPLGIWAVIRLIPPHVLEENRARAAEVFATHRPVSRVGALVIITIWIVVALALARWLWPMLATMNGLSNPL